MKGSEINILTNFIIVILDNMKIYENSSSFS